MVKKELTQSKGQKVRQDLKGNPVPRVNPVAKGKLVQGETEGIREIKATGETEGKQGR
jgi:hypothetical protein